jgi:hypothetical protein
MKIKHIALLAVVSSLSGCAALEQMHQDWLKENCNPSSSYNQGLTDGLTPAQMPHSYASSCPANNAAINDAYLKGFTEGLKSRPQEININKNVNVNEKKS